LGGRAERKARQQNTEQAQRQKESLHRKDDSRSRHPDEWRLSVNNGIFTPIMRDTMDPSLVVARSKVPVLAPEAPYEAHYGAKPGIVYACGATAKGDELTLYYGGADSVVCAYSSRI
jgi:hypothetical protein